MRFFVLAAENWARGPKHAMNTYRAVETAANAPSLWPRRCFTVAIVVGGFSVDSRLHCLHPTAKNADYRTAAECATAAVKVSKGQGL